MFARIVRQSWYITQVRTRQGGWRTPYNLAVDPRFRFRRRKASDQELRHEQQSEQDRVQRVKSMSYGLVIPAYLVSGTVAGWLAGSWLDQRFGTAFWLPTLVVLFTIASFAMVIRLMASLNN